MSPAASASTSGAPRARTAPSSAGPTRRASTAAAAAGNASEYLLQLQEKQKARFTYGLTERQFRNLYEEANRRKGVTGEIMLQLPRAPPRQRRVPRRLGVDPARRPASSSSHGHVDVNGKRVDIPSYRVRKGDVVSLRGKARADDLRSSGTATSSPARHRRGSTPRTKGSR